MAELEALRSPADTESRFSGLGRSLRAWYIRDSREALDFQSKESSRCTTYVFPFEVAVSSSQGLYHLLHVCHDPKGREAMEKAVYSAGKLRAWQSGSQALLTNPQIEKEILEQLRLQPDQGALELAGALWLQETFWLMTWRGDFALALRNLENQGLVEIYRRVDKPKRRKGSQPNADLDRVRLLQH